eukprot:1143018-Pleurochrysis_carterae.AAC.1
MVTAKEARRGADRSNYKKNGNTVAGNEDLKCIITKGKRRQFTEARHMLYLGRRARRAGSLKRTDERARPAARAKGGLAFPVWRSWQGRESILTWNSQFQIES